LTDEKSPRFLFVDNLSPIEIMVSFSSLSKWYEQRIEVIPEKTIKNKKEHDAALAAECKFLQYNLDLKLEVLIFFNN
jgi:hypothetical protein